MNALLVRAGIDQEAGKWNGPVDLPTRQFVYVAIPEDSAARPGMNTPYSSVRPPLAVLGCALPTHLAQRDMHLDPDFDHLTYGEGPKARQLGSLSVGDVLVFYAALEDLHKTRPLVYAIIGLYVVDTIESAASVPSVRWSESAHTRRLPLHGDLIAKGKPGVSGRLDRCLPIGGYRQRAYRVFPDLLTAWGGLSVKDGFIQRNGVAPHFLEPEIFYQWFQSQGVSLVQRNN